MNESPAPPSTLPSVALLDKAFAIPWDPQLPLHAKVYRGLHYAIENFFEDGQRFFTEKELIQYLKVSQVTVRRAVYDLVTEGLLQRRVAKGSFVRKRSNVGTDKTLKIALHLVDWDSSFLSQLLREILSVCNARQLDAKVFYSRQSGDILGFEGEAWNQSEISAAILVSTPPDLATELCRRYESVGKRIVAVDARAPSDHAHFVGTDNEATVKLGLDYLVGLGHERICLLLNEPEENENVMLRAKYFETECQARGLSGSQIVHCGTKFWEDSYTKAYQAMPQAMVLKPTPTAVFAFDDQGAWAALKWCFNHGVRVPQDLSLLGFADDKPSAFTQPALTTLAHPIADLAATAVDLITSDRAAPVTKLFSPSLVVRESAGPVKQPHPV